jgi:hypothetical protein
MIALICAQDTYITPHPQCGPAPEGRKHPPRQSWPGDAKLEKKSDMTNIA